MKFIPKYPDNTEKEIEDILLLYQYPRIISEKSSKQEFLNRFNQSDTIAKFEFCKRLMFYLMEKDYKLFLQFFQSSYILSKKSIKSI